MHCIFLPAPAPPHVVVVADLPTSLDDPNETYVLVGKPSRAECLFRGSLFKPEE